MGISAVSSARSALSSLIKPFHGITFGKDLLVNRFLRGVFNIRPALPPYITTWYVKMFFSFSVPQKTTSTSKL